MPEHKSNSAPVGGSDPFDCLSELSAIWALEIRELDDGDRGSRWSLHRCVGRLHGEPGRLEINGDTRRCLQLPDERSVTPLRPQSSTFPGFIEGIAKEGYVGLQDHGYGIWFRNIKIREL